MSVPNLRESPRLAQALLESDRRYFELGAVCESVRGADIVHMPGFARTPAGCVVQRIDATRIGFAAAAWLAALEHRLRALGCRLSRLYVEGEARALVAALRARGYRARVELGYARTISHEPADAGVALRPVDSESGWRRKRALHRACALQADGYADAAGEWVTLERRKCEAGGMRCFLIEVDGVVRGACATISVDGFVRLKNLVIHPTFRRCGLATAALRLAAIAGAREGALGIGAFAVAGNAGDTLYRSEGLAVVTRQIEWAKTLGNGKGESA